MEAQQSRPTQYVCEQNVCCYRDVRLKPSSLIKREFKDIFQKNDCSFDSENPTQMHFIAFTCKEWKLNSLGRYGMSASKTCFVTAMFAR